MKPGTPLMNTRVAMYSLCRVCCTAEAILEETPPTGIAFEFAESIDSVNDAAHAIIGRLGHLGIVLSDMGHPAHGVELR